MTTKLFEGISSYYLSWKLLLQNSIFLAVEGFSNFHRFAATAACNPPDIKCINAFREKAKGIPKLG